MNLKLKGFYRLMMCKISFNSLFLLLFPFWVFAQESKILQYKINDSNYEQVFSEISAWQNSREATWTKKLTALPVDQKALILRDADTANVFNWPSISAAMYLDYQRTGNRTGYESAVNLRRAKLNQLAVGEMLSRKGTYVEQLANGLWLCLEESTWVSPAHIVVQHAGGGLADPYDSYIDLGAARFAADLAAIYRGLAEELDAYSPQLRRRIRFELEKRILEPYLLRKDFWWMGYGKGLINNWNIWINNNVLRTALLLMEDSAKQKQVVLKVLESADKFIDFYPEDGACEEGASYWMHAAGEMGAMLDLMVEVSNREFEVSKVLKLLRMGQYILNMHIDGNRFVNFADAMAIEYPAPAKVFVFGELFDDEALKAFSAYLWERKAVVSTTNVQDLLFFSAKYSHIIASPAKAHKVETLVYPSLEMVRWQGDVSGRGLTFVGIGRHNAVSHNHNDVGSFMLFADNEPVLIDVGVGTYTGKTFSNKRYELWNMQSQWHNLPTINGVLQKEGASYKASAVQLPLVDRKFEFSLDLSTAYPAAAMVSCWLRSFSFRPAEEALCLQENYVLEQAVELQRLHYISAIKPVLKGNTLWIDYATTASVSIQVDTDNLVPTVEELLLTDPRHQKVWGERVYRITYVEKNKSLKGNYNFIFKIIRSN